MVSLAAIAQQADASASLDVVVLDRASQPVSDVVVIATPQDTTPAPLAPGTVTAIVDQVNKQFVPRVIVIRTGTAVLFPNSDSVAHQIYSFSPAKRFALDLYRGRPYPPMIFDKPGVVVLGCNIHDHMVGYVYVTGSPYFGKTDASGRLRFDAIPDGAYLLSAWSPRFDEPRPLEQPVLIGKDASASASFRLTRDLRAAPGDRPDAPRVRDY